MLIQVFLHLICVHFSLQDVYLHNPRGSNNRLNEASAKRANNNRLFDSQNNARGGYNIGDATSQAAKNEQQQYQMRYFQSGSGGRSTIEIEWTNQHGCGGGGAKDSPTKQNCQIVLQYMCQPASDIKNDDPDRIRDGTAVDTPAYTRLPNNGETLTGFENRKQGDVNLNRGLHESWQYYDSCVNRERNAGLFTADKGLGRNPRGYSGAVYTRQNPGGTQRGYECPEERDYWPYWHPSPWRDVAVLTNNLPMCSFITSESFNIKPKNLCIELYNGTEKQKTWSRWNNQADCVKNGGIWTQLHNYLEKAPQFKDEKSCVSQSTNGLTYIWAVPWDSTNVNRKECLVGLPAPECKQADWTRSNHLGNTPTGAAPIYKWQLPFFPSKRVQTCVFRVRYNISTDDFDQYNTDSKFNGAKSPVKQDPSVDIGANKQVLQLAINTDQYGRVFQDRSHSFILLPRPTLIGDSATIHNLNVRGKRGNIVQVYPAVEYDFVPSNVGTSVNDIVHIQWTGSNSHLNGPPVGDGQGGNDGQGRDGTDRSNLVQISDLNENFPLPTEIASLWSGDVDLVGYLNDLNYTDDPNTYLTSKQGFNSKDVALYLASAGYYKCVKSAVCGASSYESLSKGNALDSDLNSASASLPGVLIRFTRPNKVYYYMCSRNNNFSNRSQKGAISVI